MGFKTLKIQLAKNFETATKSRALFETTADKDTLWNLYLDSFPVGTNHIYREQREYDCHCCCRFIKEIGGVVYIDDDLNLHSIFDFDTGSEMFQLVMDALNSFVKSHAIKDVYLSKSRNVGTDHSVELDDDGTHCIWDHFFLKLPDHLVFDGRDTIDAQRGEFRDTRNVFKRALDEFSVDSIDSVFELICSNSLYRGSEWKTSISELRNHKHTYDGLSDDKKEIYCWSMAPSIGNVLGRIRNHSIGTLLIDLSGGMDLDEAVRRYERVVAPTNYKRPKPIFTQKMLDDARQTITEMGYLDSLPRRFATLDDITVNNLLFSNRDSAKRVSGDVFDSMMSEVKSNPKQFSRVEDISVESFLNNVLPNAAEIEAYVENRHVPNMVSLIAPQNRDAKSMFKWNNGFSWAYAGNLTDSDIRKNVKSAGGKVDGALRFSIQWNDTEYDANDLDAHCHENYKSKQEHIYYVEKFSHISRGRLDVDIRVPTRGAPAVENITYSSKDAMPAGQYRFSVHCFNNRGGKGGFRAEVEFDGWLYYYDYRKPLRQGDTVEVAVVTLDEYRHFSIDEKLPSQSSTRDIWGIKTNTFVPVSVVMFSPNYWDEQQGIGNRHYFFMLNGCVNPETPNGFYNEFLKQDILKHGRVLEALGGKMAVHDAEDQLSGLGFSSTMRNDLIVKVKGATERILRIKF